MRSHIMTILHRRNPHCWVVLNGLPYGIKGVFAVMFVEETKETPHSRASTVVVLRFDIYGSLLDLRDPT
jgi:hypothetical protein